ncbi:MAG: DUF3459 domain-containing protein [Anaerolineae bacterium]|nr:DUF3459 domain-containing protein [Anaerolineae bacterium]
MSLPRTWWHNAVIYQIYPRSFMDSNGDGVGDLLGIIHRLDYLVELGVDIIWISPIYPSPMADFGYDVSNYTDVHPMFGDLATFDRLLAEAHTRGLRIVLDFVPSHSSDEHPWFIESRSSRDNPKRDWYYWRDAQPDGSPPNNWESFFGGPAWAWDEHTRQYYLHLFDVKQPDLNWRNPDVVAAIHEALRFWLRRGVDGFRVDVVTFILKHPEMPDNPFTSGVDFFNQITETPVMIHRYDVNQPEVHEVIRGIRQVLEEFSGERLFIGETWFFDHHELATYYGKNLDEIHIPFNFTLMKQPWDAAGMRANLRSYYAALPEGAVASFVLGSHDEPRLATRYGHRNHRAAGLLLLTLQGVPVIYYGDEIGMQNIDLPVEKIQDPQGKFNPAATRDPERSPMQWDSTANAGFSPEGVETWLPIAQDYEQVNVMLQHHEPTSTLNFYRQLLALRKSSDALRWGAITLLADQPNHALAYTRTLEGERWLVVINFADAPATLDCSSGGASGTVRLATYARPEDQTEVELAALELPANQGLLIQLAG